MREDGWLLTLPGRYVEGMLTCSLDNKNTITSHKTKNNMQWIQATTTSMPLRSRQGVSQWSQAACGLRFVFGASEWIPDTKHRPGLTKMDLSEAQPIWDVGSIMCSACAPKLQVWCTASHLFGVTSFFFNEFLCVWLTQTAMIRVPFAYHISSTYSTLNTIYHLISLAWQRIQVMGYDFFFEKGISFH
jgi:hypothetical protein